MKRARKPSALNDVVVDGGVQVRAVYENAIQAARVREKKFFPVARGKVIDGHECSAVWVLMAWMRAR